jgi:hypothetical protein
MVGQVGGDAAERGGRRARRDVRRAWRGVLVVAVARTAEELCGGGCVGPAARQQRERRVGTTLWHAETRKELQRPRG